MKAELEKLISELIDSKKTYDEQITSMSGKQLDYEDTEDLGIFMGKSEVLEQVIDRLTKICMIPSNTKIVQYTIKQ